MSLKRYIKNGKGNTPIILSCPHGGYKKPEHIPDIKNGAKHPDRYTYFLGKHIIQELKKNEIDIYYVLSKLHRKKLDLNRPPKSSSAFNPSSLEAEKTFLEYHRIIHDFAQECVTKYQKCLFIDLHGFTRPNNVYPDLILGNVFGNTLAIKSKSSNNNQENYWCFSEFVSELSKDFTLDNGFGLTELTLPYSGGYITHRFYHKNKINAFQLEIAKYIRQNRVLLNKFINAFLIAVKKCLKH